VAPLCVVGTCRGRGWRRGSNTALQPGMGTSSASATAPPAHTGCPRSVRQRPVKGKARQRPAGWPPPTSRQHRWTACAAPIANSPDQMAPRPAAAPGRVVVGPLCSETSPADQRWNHACPFTLKNEARDLRDHIKRPRDVVTGGTGKRSGCRQAATRPGFSRGRRIASCSLPLTPGVTLDGSGLAQAAQVQERKCARLRARGSVFAMRGACHSEPVLTNAASLPSEDGLPSVPSAGLALDRARSVSPPSGSELDDLAQLVVEDYEGWRVGGARRSSAPRAPAKRRCTSRPRTSGAGAPRSPDHGPAPSPRAAPDPAPPLPGAPPVPARAL
jgi:hypothetical protein